MSSRITKLILGLALAIAPFLAAAPALAQTAAASGMKIAVIDTERILLTSNTGKKALADLKKLQEAKEGEARTKQQEIKDLQAKLTDGRLSLAQD
jgi:Skp family chaperone for outer membrane proteins